MEYIFRGVGRLSNLVFVEGKGSWVKTSCGREILDFTSGIGVTNTGHCHPAVVSAAKDQCDKIIHAQVNLGGHRPMVDLTNKLVTIMPYDNLNRIFYSTTGAEAVGT